MVHPCPICDLEPQILRCGGVVLDRRRAILTIAGEEAHVEPCEFEVLEILMCDPGRVWSKARIVAQIDPAGMRNLAATSINTYIYRLRKRIGRNAYIGTCNFGWWIEPFTENIRQPIYSGRRTRLQQEMHA